MLAKLIWLDRFGGVLVACFAISGYPGYDERIAFSTFCYTRHTAQHDSSRSTRVAHSAWEPFQARKRKPYQLRWRSWGPRRYWYQYQNLPSKMQIHWWWKVLPICCSTGEGTMSIAIFWTGILPTLDFWSAVWMGHQVDLLQWEKWMGSA